jgi:hypothetical protein
MFALRLAVTRQCIVEIERQGPGFAFETVKRRLGLVELCLRQAGDSRAYSAFALEPLDFEGLALGQRLGSGGEVFPETFAVQPAGNPIDDLPGGIREL